MLLANEISRFETLVARITLSATASSNRANEFLGRRIPREASRPPSFSFSLGR